MNDRLAASARVLVLAREPLRLDDLPVGRRGPFVVRLIRRLDDLALAADEFEPDVVLVDTTFADGGSFSAIERLLLHAPELPVLALTPTPPPHDHVARATRAGAVGFIASGADPADLTLAIDALCDGETWFPQADTRRVLSAVAGDLDTTSTERRSRLTGAVLALVPLTGLLAALQAGFWRRYMGRIGVRPVDLAVDPTTRVIDVIVSMLLVIGFVGPLLFVGTWLDLLRDSRLNRGVLAKLLRRRRMAHLLVSVAWLLTAAVLAIGPDAGLVLIVGPAVSVSVIAQVLGVSDELPRPLRIERVSMKAAIAGGLLVLFLFIAVLSYEVFVVGPDLRADGEHGLIAPRVLGVNAIPVRAVNVDTEESNDVLYLGGNADLYVFVDPCDNDRVDYVSVGSHRLVVIDEVICAPDGS